MRVSYMEIYNEEIIDLLGAETADNPRLRIYEDRKVHALVCRYISSPEMGLEN